MPRPLSVFAMWALATAVVGSTQPLQLRAENAWAREAPASRDVTSAYVVLVNSGDTALAVVKAASPLAKTVEFHEMWMEGGMMRMRQLSRLQVPPHGRVELKPSGLHLMIFGLSRALGAGDVLPLILTLDGGQTLSLEARVRTSDEVLK